MPSMTITTDAGQAQRLATALGRKLDLRDNGVPRDATAAEIKKFTVDMLRGVVHEYETERDRAQIQPPAAFDPS